MSTPRTFTIYGEPEGKPRPRLGGRFIYSPRTKWDRSCEIAAVTHRPREKYEGAVYLRVILIFPRAKSLSRKLFWKTSRPDADNTAKSVMDAMTKARWWTDDAQVAHLIITKRYTQPGEEPSAIVYVDNAQDQENA